MLLVSLMMIAWASWPPLSARSRQRLIATGTDAPTTAPTWPRQRPRRRGSAALPHQHGYHDADHGGRPTNEPGRARNNVTAAISTMIEAASMMKTSSCVDPRPGWITA